MVPTTSRPVTLAPFSRPAAWRRSTGVGGVLRMNVNVRSSKTVISTGTIVPVCASVAALYCLQKSMIATPWGPSAVPTGGAGVAFPAGIWILTTAATFLLAMTCSLQPFSKRPSMMAAVKRARQRSRLQLGDLAELQLDGRLPAEDVDQHLQLELVGVDLDDLAGEVGKWAFLHPHALADLVLQPGLG